MYQCDFCNYESIYKYNVMRHEEGKHGQKSNTNNQEIHPNSNQVQQPLETELKTSYMQINPEQNSLVVQNQYLQNKNIELQSLLRNQNIQTNQTFSPRKRFRSDNDNESEILPDSMDTDEHPQDFLSESDSEESDTDAAHELEDSISDLDINYTETLRLRKRYLKALEKYNEIEDEDKRNINISDNILKFMCNISVRFFRI